jgi:hypothetical protein
VSDGTKAIQVFMQEYYLEMFDSVVYFPVQGNWKDQEHVFTLCGQGSIYYLLIDGKLAVDGTGKLTVATASNFIHFGDSEVGASENSDAIWSYVKYYQGGMLLPTAATSTCSEFAHWSGDKSALYASLWNSGSPVSVKQLCGVPRNYQFEQVVQRERRRGITGTPTTTATTPTLVTDLEAYVIGGTVFATSSSPASNSVAGTNTWLATITDGEVSSSAANTLDSTVISTPVANYDQGMTHILPKQHSIGLHKVESRYWVGANTSRSVGTQRNLTVEARS